MKNFLFLGDIHGKIKEIPEVCKEYPCYAVGDLGAGFKGVDLKDLPPNLRFIRGNHDSPEVCQKHPSYLGDFGFLKREGIFYLSGADSIDKNLRVEGIDWWRDEELSYKQLCDAINLFALSKPKIMLSHTCPSFLKRQILSQCSVSPTESALEEMFNLWEPKFWIFGHFHESMVKKSKNTTFICLSELESRWINL